MRLTNRALGIAFLLLSAGISRLLDQVPHRLQELLAIAMIAVGLAVFVSVPYPDVRTWILHSWAQASTLISAYGLSLALLLWVLYMQLRGRERQAYQAMTITLVLVVIASAARRNAAA